MTVIAYCAQNGIKIKTYYYYLSKVREQCLESETAIEPVAVPRSTLDIRIGQNGLKISFPIEISADTRCNVRSSPSQTMCHKSLSFNSSLLLCAWIQT